MNRPKKQSRPIGGKSGGFFISVAAAAFLKYFSLRLFLRSIIMLGAFGINF
jgi:hypothetical protein